MNWIDNGKRLWTEAKSSEYDCPHTETAWNLWHDWCDEHADRLLAALKLAEAIDQATPDCDGFYYIHEENPTFDAYRTECDKDER